MIPVSVFVPTLSVFVPAWSVAASVWSLQGRHNEGDLHPVLKTRSTRPSDDGFHRLRRQPDVRPNVMAGRLNEGR